MTGVQNGCSASFFLSVKIVHQQGPPSGRPLDFCLLGVLYFHPTGAISLSKRRLRRSFGKRTLPFSKQKNGGRVRLFMRAA
jgi:hypothetical protein